MPVGESASTQVEPGELVVRADARSGGQCAGLEARPSSAARTDLFSRV